jgi:DNA-binding IclR family transcriptional regulator
MEHEIKFKRIQCLDRALDVITLVSESHGLTMNEIAEQMDLKPGTVYNIVKTLSSRGFLSKVDGHFEVGPALGMAASRWDIERSLPHMAEPVLRELRQQTGEATCITILAGDNRAELITLQPDHPNYNSSCVHTIWEYPLYIATGRVLVALGPEEKWAGIINTHLKSGLIAEAEKDWDYQRWYKELEQIRADGFTIISPRMESSGSVSAVGVPMFKPNGELLASIGVSSKQERATPEHLTAMKDAALALVKRNPLWGTRGE